MLCTGQNHTLVSVMRMTTGEPQQKQPIRIKQQAQMQLRCNLESWFRFSIPYWSTTKTRQMEQHSSSTWPNKVPKHLAPNCVRYPFPAVCNTHHCWMTVFSFHDAGSCPSSMICSSTACLPLPNRNWTIACKITKKTPNILGHNMSQRRARQFPLRSQKISSYITMAVLRHATDQHGSTISSISKMCKRHRWWWSSCRHAGATETGTCLNQMPRAKISWNMHCKWPTQPAEFGMNAPLNLMLMIANYRENWIILEIHSPVIFQEFLISSDFGRFRIFNVISWRDLKLLTSQLSVFSGFAGFCWYLREFCGNLRVFCG